MFGLDLIHLTLIGLVVILVIWAWSATYQWYMLRYVCRTNKYMFYSFGIGERKSDDPYHCPSTPWDVAKAYKRERLLEQFKELKVTAPDNLKDLLPPDERGENPLQKALGKK